MADVPMPRDLSEEAVREWMDGVDEYELRPVASYSSLARAVRALVEQKVREAVRLARKDEMVDALLKIRGWTYTPAEIVARVMGEEAPRG